MLYAKKPKRPDLSASNRGLHGMPNALKSKKAVGRQSETEAQSQCPDSWTHRLC